MVGDFIICLLAFLNIYIYLCFIYFLIKKKRGPERGPEGGPKGVQKGGADGRVHVLSMPCLVKHTKKIYGLSQIFNKYRAFSLTWPSSMQIYWNKGIFLHKKRVQLPQDWFGTPTWPPFHCFVTPIWPP